MTPSADPHRLPVWLLDIDGVVNAIARHPAQDSWPEHEWLRTVICTEIPGQGMLALPILAAQPVLDFITGVHRRGAAQVLWHSTWRAAAMTALAPALGLPAIPISIAPEWLERPVGTWWKLPAAQRVQAAGRPLVWTDDDLGVYAAEVGDLGAREDVLLIAPDRTTGLTSEHLDRIAEFLDLPATGSGPPVRTVPPR